MSAATLEGSAAKAAESVRAPSDFWSPILVKEVRQALRGRVFRVTFVMTLAAALLAALSQSVGPDALGDVSQARSYFLSLYFCLVVALVVVVPLGAFQAVGNEWEESTFDLLTLTHLQPRRIVLGKVWSACVQGGLFLSALMPFFAITSLLRGIDLRAAALVLLWVGVTSFALTLLGVALSTLSKVRFVRVVLMLALGAAMMPFLAGLPSAASQALRDPSDFTSLEALLAMGSSALLILIAGSYAFGIACNMLAHPEENRSTNLRVVTTCGSILALSLVSFLAEILSSALDFISAMTIGGLVVVSVVDFFFLTERRTLGQRVSLHVPRSPLVALLVSPWLPGGGRGVLLHALHVAGITLWGAILMAIHRVSPTNPLADGFGAVLVTALLALVYVPLLPGVFAWLLERPGGRLVVRIGAPVLLLLSILVPGVVGAFTRDRDLAQLQHLANPFWVVERAYMQDGVTLQQAALFGGLALVALLINAPRVIAGIFEVLRAAGRRSARSAARAQEGAALGDPVQ
ncbi:MAG: hypothetical protein R3F49_08760 [Planctomycetota bacterium]